MKRNKNEDVEEYEDEWEEEDDAEEEDPDEVAIKPATDTQLNDHLKTIHNHAGGSFFLVRYDHLLYLKGDGNATIVLAFILNVLKLKARSPKNREFLKEKGLWFRCMAKTIEKKLGMTKDKRIRCMTRLSRAGLLEISYRRGNVLWLKVNTDTLKTVEGKDSEDQKSGNPTSRSREMGGLEQCTSEQCSGNPTSSGGKTRLPYREAVENLNLETVAGATARSLDPFERTASPSTPLPPEPEQNLPSPPTSCPEGGVSSFQKNLKTEGIVTSCQRGSAPVEDERKSDGVATSLSEEVAPAQIKKKSKGKPTSCPERIGPCQVKEEEDGFGLNGSCSSSPHEDARDLAILLYNELKKRRKVMGKTNMAKWVCAMDGLIDDIMGREEMSRAAVCDYIKGVIVLHVAAIHERHEPQALCGESFRTKFMQIERQIEVRQDKKAEGFSNFDDSLYR